MIIDYKFNYIFEFEIANVLVLDKTWKFIEKTFGNTNIIVIFYN